MVTTPKDSEPISIKQEAAEEADKVLLQLQEYVDTVTSKTEGMPLSKATEWGEAFLTRAGCIIPRNFRQMLLETRSNVEVREPYHNQKLKLASSKGAWGSLLVDKKFNVIVAGPKVGKSAIIAHIFACARRGDETCLGKPIRKRWNKLIISGSDMDSSDWGKVLVREGLAECIGDMESDDAEFLPCDDVLIWDLGNPARMNEKGNAAMRDKCLEYPDSLLVIDCLRSNVDASYDENTAAIRKPIEDTKAALSACEVTVALIHHANKGVSGSTAVNAASGSNAISGSCDGTLLLKYMVPDAAVDALRTDWRILAISSGRLRNDNALVELTRTGIGEWFHHENIEDAMKQEAIYAMEEKLTNKQERVYEHACEIAENGVHITVMEVSNQISLSRQAARKTLEQLTRKGLLVRCGTFETGQSGREAILYAPTLSDLARAKRKESGVLNTLITPNTVKNPMNPMNPVPTHPRASVDYPLGSPLERRIGDEWIGGCLLANGSDPDKVIATKTGDLNTRYTNLRWGHDVRPCESPFKQPEPEPEPVPSDPSQLDLDDLPF